MGESTGDLGNLEPPHSAVPSIHSVLSHQMPTLARLCFCIQAGSGEETGR